MANKTKPYQVTVVGNTSTGGKWDTSQFGEVCGIEKPGQWLGLRGDREHFRLMMRIPDGHPVLGPVIYGETAKYAFKIDFELAGISGDTIAKIKDKSIRSPRKRKKFAPLECLIQVCEIQQPPLPPEGK